jgi:tRNA-splicing ligase RtcB
MGDGVRIFGQHEEGTLKQLAHVAGRAERVALMADGHPGYVMPIGAVAAFRDCVSVAGVGFDIGCGNAAVRTDLSLAELAPNPKKFGKTMERLADRIAGAISFGLGRRNTADDAPVDHPLFTDPAWEAAPAAEREKLRDRARQQLGTVGSGNHYVDVFVDENGMLWVGVHFGSRGLGYTVASAFLSIGHGGGWGDHPPAGDALLELSRPAGHDYWHLMELAGRYAHAGREWVARRVVELLGANEVEMVHNHHNFAWRETHLSPEGEETEYVVVRKGATPAFPGQTGFIGGSMGDDAVIVRGASPDASSGDAEGEETARMQREAMFSTVHGAGRVMTRSAAIGVRNRSGKTIHSGRVTPEKMGKWLREKGVVLRGGDLDESPHVYRRLPKVLEAQGPTIEVVHTLRPLVVVMAGAEEIDPYKD